MRLFFKLLYTRFAWLYDFVASSVSFGEWNTLTKTIVDYIDPVSTLELGFGTGHLQYHLLRNDFPVFGLDSSWEMAQICFRRIKQSRELPHLVLASSTHIPFTEQSFQQVICTFPSEYIFQHQTLKEIQRVLSPKGKLVVLLGVSITGGSLPQKLLRWIYQITGQPTDLHMNTLARIYSLFAQFSLKVQGKTIQHDFFSLTYLIAVKTQ